MKALLAILRYTWTTAWYAFAVFAVLLAVLFSGARLMLPHAEDYRADLQARLSDFIGQPARIKTLDAEWRGLGPSLVLKDVTLLDQSGESPVLAFQKVRVGVNLLASLLERDIVLSGITLVGLDLTLTKFADGRIAMQGMASNGRKQNLDAVTHWLFTQRELRIEDSNFTWIDQRLSDNPGLRMSEVNILLRNDDEHHWLDISLSLPEGTGSSLVLSLDMEGDPVAVAEGRRTQVYAKGAGISLSRLFPGLVLAGVATTVDNAGFELWLRWVDGELQDLRGDIDLQSIHLTAGTGSRSVQRLIDEVSGQFAWQREGDGWRFEGDRLILARGGAGRQPSRLSVSYGHAPDAVEGDASPHLSLAASSLRLDVLGELLPLAAAAQPAENSADASLPRLLAALQAIRPRGRLLVLHGDWAGGRDLSVYASFEELNGEAWEKVPALRNARGQLWLGGEQAQLHLAGAGVILDLRQMFRAPLVVDDVTGDIAWQKTGDGWRLAGRNLSLSNEDIHLHLTLDLLKDAEHASPFISLMGEFLEANGRSVSKYLPTGILKPNTVAWLDHAIRDGYVSRGGMVLHGRLNRFPYLAGDGCFEVRFDLQDGLLDYAQDWPPIADIRAEVTFRGQGMSIDAEHGRIFQSEILWTRVSIADMRAHPLVVVVKGEVSGPTQEKLDYLNQAPPLRRKFATMLDILEARGDSLLTLDLTLPVHDNAHTRVSGSVQLEDNALWVRPVGEVLTHAGGRLEFSSKGLRADPMELELLGQPVVLEIDSGPAGKTRVQARGHFDAADLARRYLPQIADLLDGGSEWDVRLDVPMGGDVGRGEARMAILHVETPLVGTTSRLPPPLDKAAEELLPLKLQMNFPAHEEPRLHLALGGYLSGIFEFGQGGPLGLRRGELRFNAGNATLPEQAGLRLSGWLDHFSLDDWSTILGGDGGDTASWVLSTDLAIREGELYGQTLHNLNLKVASEERQWRIGLDSLELKGEIVVPRADVHRALEANLAYCRLDELLVATHSGSPMDPRRLPPLKVRIGDLRYKNLRYGGLLLETLPVHNGLKIRRMLLTPQNTRVSAEGGWFMRNERPFSKFDFHVESDNVEDTLKAFGYLNSIAGGKGVMDMSLQWPGSPAEMLDRMGEMRGKVHLALRKGQLLEVDPGAGRLFGLLSVQTLPRRLLLDFSDVFREGFRFDRLEGDFLVEDGDAYTSNLYMIGPAARLDITGRIGLVAQDYDQLVTVTPRLSETLPLIGALALTPQIGAAILFVQKVMEPQINKATQMKYSVTGPWSSPRVVKLKRPKPTEAETSSVFDE